jgi:copper oxidase (laccase) domain-containing protein
VSKVLLEQKLSFGGIRVFDDRPDFPFYEVSQVHGREVLKALDSKKEDQADGLYSLNPQELQWPMAIKTADCLPITLIGKKGVAHLHAGWRGLQLEIHNHPEVAKIIPQEVFIGPSIHQESYEVGHEFYEHFVGMDNYLKEKNKEKLLFDLPGCAEEMILKSYPHSRIILSEINTFSTPGHNSYRKDQTTQRNYNLFYPEHLW